MIIAAGKLTLQLTQEEDRNYQVAKYDSHGQGTVARDMSEAEATERYRTLSK